MLSYDYCFMKLRVCARAKSNCTSKYYLVQIMLSFAQRVHTQRGKLIQIQISCKPAKPILLKLTVTNNHEFQEIMGIRQNPGSSETWQIILYMFGKLEKKPRLYIFFLWLAKKPVVSWLFSLNKKGAHTFLK